MIRQWQSSILVLGLIMGLWACGHGTAFPSPEHGETLALVGGTLLDGRGILFSQGTLLIRNGTIVSVEEYRENQLPQAYRVIDVSGLWIMPGLINTHVHLKGAEDLKAFARDGVTTVRDLAARSRDWMEMAELSRQNSAYSRLVCASPILTVDKGYGTPVLSKPEDAEKVVREWAEAGAAVIKFSLESNLNQKLWKVMNQDMSAALGKAADRLGLRLSVHISRDQYISQALEAGVDDIAHMPVDRISDRNLSRVADAGVFWIPTLELWSQVALLAGDSWIQVPLDNLRRFRAAGGRVALGTDYNGWDRGKFDLGMPMTEMGLMWKAGMTMEEIVKSATSEAAEVCGLGDVTGSLIPGLEADLVILEKNPLESPENFSSVIGVYHGGVSLR